MRLQNTLAKILTLYAIAYSNVALAQGGPSPDATVRLSIDIERPRGPFTLHLNFERTRVEEDALLVTSLNLVDGDTPKDMQVGNLTDYASHLTGWFVIKQTQELWVGITLNKGESAGSMELQVPGLLEETSDYPPKYELVYGKSDGTLSSLASGAKGVTYARLSEITIEQPSWGTVDEKASAEWAPQRGNVFSLTPTSIKSNSAQLTVMRDPNFLADWMAKSLAPFSAGLAAATIVFVVLLQMSERVERWHRLMCGGILLLCLILLDYFGGVWPLNFKQMLFDGAGLLGVALPTLAFLVLPEPYLARLGHFVERLRGSEAPATPIVQPQGSSEQ